MKHIFLREILQWMSPGQMCQIHVYDCATIFLGLIGIDSIDSICESVYRAAGTSYLYVDRMEGLGDGRKGLEIFCRRM